MPMTSDLVSIVWAHLERQCMYAFVCMSACSSVHVIFTEVSLLSQLPQKPVLSFKCFALFAKGWDTDRETVYLKQCEDHMGWLLEQWDKFDRISGEMHCRVEVFAGWYCELPASEECREFLGHRCLKIEFPELGRVCCCLEYCSEYVTSDQEFRVSLLFACESFDSPDELLEQG